MGCLPISRSRFCRLPDNSNLTFFTRRHSYGPPKKLSELKAPGQGGSPILLRNHPLFNHRGVCSWPPVWTWISGLDNEHPVGEIGILRDVQLSNIEPADRCFLYVDFDGASYIGCLLVD